MAAKPHNSRRRDCGEKSQELLLVKIRMTKCPNAQTLHPLTHLNIIWYNTLLNVPQIISNLKFDDGGVCWPRFSAKSAVLTDYMRWYSILNCITAWSLPLSAQKANTSIYKLYLCMRVMEQNAANKTWKILPYMPKKVSFCLFKRQTPSCTIRTCLKYDRQVSLSVSYGEYECFTSL